MLNLKKATKIIKKNIFCTYTLGGNSKPDQLNDKNKRNKNYFFKSSLVKTAL